MLSRHSPDDQIPKAPREHVRRGSRVGASPLDILSGSVQEGVETRDLPVGWQVGPELAGTPAPLDQSPHCGEAGLMGAA